MGSSEFLKNVLQFEVESLHEKITGRLSIKQVTKAITMAMDPIHVFLIALALIILAFFGIYLFGIIRAKKKIGIFNKFIDTQYPELKAAKFITASEVSRSSAITIALLIDETQRRILTLQIGKDGQVTDSVYPFDSLAGFEPQNRVIERGVWPSKMFSYEKSLNLRFDEGAEYHMFLEFITNKHATDKAPAVLDQAIKPWEEALSRIVNKEI